MAKRKQGRWKIVALFGAGIVLQARSAVGDLGPIVEEYFRAPVEQRRAIVRQIEKLAEGNVTAVTEAIRSARLWGKTPTRGTWTTELSRQRSVQIVYQLPEAYDPAAGWPVVICMPDGATAAAVVLRECENHVPGAARGMVRIVPTLSVGGTFTLDDPAAAVDLRTLLIEIRRRIHTDTRRTYLFGQAEGGDAAWVALFTQPEYFSHATVVCSYSPLPCLEHLLPLLSENLRSIRPAAGSSDDGGPPGGVLTMIEVSSGASCGSTAADDHMRSSLVRGVSRAFAAYGRDSGLRVVQVSDVRGDDDSVQRRGGLIEKVPYPDELSLWFRYPALGRIGWLRQTRWEGPVWEAEAISIRPAATSDRDGFITGVLKDQLGYLGGRKVGQTLHIETRRCAEVELRVPESWDLSRPITVLINGRKRFEEAIEPDILTVLESAAESWDMQNLIVAIRRFRVSPP
jgi:hypothetical protein